MTERSGDSLGPLDRLDRLAGGFEQDDELACEDCGAHDGFMPVAPGDLRHDDCWHAHADRGHVVRLPR